MNEQEKNQTRAAALEAWVAKAAYWIGEAVEDAAASEGKPGLMYQPAQASATAQGRALLRELERIIHPQPVVGRYAVPTWPKRTAPGKCAVCRGTGRNPMSDNTNWLPCYSCNGSGEATSKQNEV